MNTVMAKSKDDAIARPLKVLVPLIQRDIEQGREAERNAGMPFYKAAGEKLVEAKAQIDHGEFIPWVKRNFGITKETASIYMRYAAHEASKKSGTPDFSSLSDFVRQTSNPNYNKPHTVRPQPWHEPVRDVINTVNVDRMAQERQAKERESRLERELALKLIDIGYKALATKLHPDKGGSTEAMHRLQRVRNRLKESI